MQTKTTMKYYLTLVRMVITKKKKKNKAENVNKDVEKPEPY